MSTPFSNSPASQFPASYTQGDRAENHDVLDLHAGVVRQEPNTRGGSSL